ncbi:MAG: hypothetical protein KME57_20995 [Scytonema hyalinum WJT4-NPBG1]|jgi:hypothetical protein|nr:hypothetical protein [Scytonema hyalinum WJT4-NPBG1]
MVRPSWQENEGLYEAAAAHFTQAGMPEGMAKTAAYIVATDSISGTQENPTERTPEMQAAVWEAWHWMNEHGKLGSQLPEVQP